MLLKGVRDRDLNRAERRERFEEGWWIVIGCDGVFGYCNFKSSLLISIMETFSFSLCFFTRILYKQQEYYFFQ